MVPVSGSELFDDLAGGGGGGGGTSIRSTGGTAVNVVPVYPVKSFLTQQLLDLTTLPAVVFAKLTVLDPQPLDLAKTVTSPITSKSKTRSGNRNKKARDEQTGREIRKNGTTRLKNTLATHKFTS